MRFTWTVAGDDPDWATLKRHGITGLFAPLFDSLTTKMYLRDFQARGYVAGLYLGHNWFPALTAEQLAKKVSVEYGRLTSASGGDPALKDVRVMFNLEQHDPEYIAATLEQWRQLRPKVGTSWSPEGMQGGWMSPEFVARVLACKVRVVPQAFLGDMTRVEGDAVLRDLLRRGFPENVISLFYDAKQLGAEWDGYAFTAGRLPMNP